MSSLLGTSFQKLRQDVPALEELKMRLPKTRGLQIPNASLADQTWFRVGGPAEVLFKPADAEDLSHFLANCPTDIPLTLIGLASNLLVRDGGVPGVVIRLGPELSSIRTDGNSLVVGCGAIDMNVAKAAQQSGLAGLEFLCAIPGTIGGGLRMNAGAYQREFKDIVTSVMALDRLGQKQILTNAEMGFSYRHSGAPSDFIFVEATLSSKIGDPVAIQTRMKEIQQAKAASQPLHEKTGGSTFANPENDPKNRKAWQLIDEAGCRGFKIGGAMISQKHCNFLINTGQATAEDIETLGEEVRKRVKETSGIELRWEIQRIGIPLKKVSSHG